MSSVSVDIAFRVGVSGALDHHAALCCCAAEVKAAQVAIFTTFGWSPYSLSLEIPPFFHQAIQVQNQPTLLFPFITLTETQPYSSTETQPLFR